jgi:hypothetical protein
MYNNNVKYGIIVITQFMTLHFTLVSFQLIDQHTANAAEDSWSYFVHGLSIRWYPILAAVLIVPVGMVRLIKYLVPFSVAANACMLAGTVAVFYFIFFGDDGENPLAPEEQAKLIVWPATRWSLFTGSALCSLEGVGMVTVIVNILRYTNMIKQFIKLIIINKFSFNVFITN